LIVIVLQETTRFSGKVAKAFVCREDEVLFDHSVEKDKLHLIT
jgi:hypothetical protein